MWLQNFFIKCLLILSIFILGCVVFIGIITFVELKDSNEKKKLVVVDSSPSFLDIPTISVHAKVEYAGLLPDGSMAVPKGFMNVAWFENGPRPGEVGSAVINGHTGYKDDQRVVFSDLHKLELGDRISVMDSQGRVVYFVVNELKIYNKDADASEVFNSDDGLSHLNLITCAGIWSVSEQTHSERLVVFADKVI